MERVIPAALELNLDAARCSIASLEVTTTSSEKRRGLNKERSWSRRAFLRVMSKSPPRDGEPSLERQVSFHGTGQALCGVWLFTCCLYSALVSFVHACSLLVWTCLLVERLETARASQVVPKVRSFVCVCVCVCVPLPLPMQRHHLVLY